ncbi:MAG: T9SS type A sorting domain-containing protein [Bacteroidia bacterium]|nr:T9SS type A sorting domain-containing protein [Bacteroidia bacterium]
MEIEFHYNPQHPYSKFERIIVIDEIYLSGVLALVTLHDNEKFKIYLNPAKGEFYLSFPAFYKLMEINIIDCVGRNVKMIKGTKRIDIGGLEKGFYFISMRFSDGTIITKKVEIN